LEQSPLQGRGSETAKPARSPAECRREVRN
jgi:hypothetical protein